MTYTDQIYDPKNEVISNLPQPPKEIEVYEQVKLFASFLSDKALSFFNNKYRNTVNQYHIFSNGAITQAFDYPQDLTREQSKQLAKFINKIDPNVRQEISVCQYGSLSVKTKYKDRDKIDHSVYIKMLAEQFESLVENDRVMAVFDGTPFILPLQVLTDGDGKWVIKGNDGYVNMFPLAKDYVEQFISSKGLKIYPEEEINEMIYTVMYHLYIFPTEKFTKEAIEVSDKRFAYPNTYNKVIGKDLFVEEGELPKWIIEL